MTINRKTWSSKWFGEWKEDAAFNRSDNAQDVEKLKLPSIYQFIESNLYTKNEINKIVDYLNSGIIIMSTNKANFPNIFTGERKAEMLSVRTDGVWAWRDDLSDYVKDHSICIPDSFFSHMRKNNFIIKNNEYSVDELQEILMRATSEDNTE